MEPKVSSSGPSSRRRDRSNRQQYQSCDRCRRGRRGCDAANLGIDPFGGSDLTAQSQTRGRGCSGCQKFNKECTFEWLRSIPRHALPRRLKTKPNPSEEKFRDQYSYDAVFLSADLSPTHHVQQLQQTDLGTNFHDELGLDLGLDGLPLPGDGLPLAVDYQLGSISQPNLSGQTAAESFFGAVYDSVSPKLFCENYFNRDSGHDPNFEMPWLGETPASRQSDLGMPIPTIDEIQATSLVGPNDLLEPDHHQDELRSPFLGWFPTVTPPLIRNALAESVSSRVAAQSWPNISMQEHRLADKSNKITISNDLMKIYCDSLENALECWIDRETCPYRIETDIGPGLHIVSEQTRSPSASKTLYYRVYKLDAAFSRQRPRPLSRAESLGSSKALKLAIMAFACQWSHTSRSSPTNLHETTLALPDEEHVVEPQATSNLEVPGEHDFERLLRLSVWHESQRCIGRWRYCGSFRVILASIVLFCSQQPLDEEEFNYFRETHLEPFASQGLGAGKSVHSSQGCFGDQLNSNAPSRNNTAHSSINNSIRDFTPSSSSFYGHEGLQNLEVSLGHLLNWRKSIISSHLGKQKETLHTAATKAPYNLNALAGSQYVSDFNLLFWLGVMCDTTTSVLKQRALIIPDADTFTSSGGVTRSDLDSVTAANFGASSWIPDVDHHRHPGRMTQSVDIWGSYLLDADRIWQRSLVSQRNLSTSQLRSKMIQRGVPLKVLFWRKVGKLQNMIFSHDEQPTSSPTPTEVENAIKEALAVHQYWTLNYGEFFATCTREHLNLSAQPQTWYLVLVLGWNMACLILARYIDFADGNNISERLGQSLRSSSALTSELRKASVYAISEAARMSTCQPTTSSSMSAGEDAFVASGMSTTKSSHPALLGQSAILSDPQTEKVVKALEIASRLLLDWLRQWRNPADGDSVLHLSWLYTNTSSDEISRHCVSCISALDLLQSKSDAAKLTTEYLTLRYMLLNAATG